MRPVVVGYDGSTSSQRALERAAMLARALGTTVIVVSVDVVVPPIVATPVGLADPTIAPIPPVPLLPEPVPDASSAVAPELADARTLLEGRGVEAEYVPASGDAAEAIVTLADERRAELIVVGSTSDRGFLDRVLAGSVSRDVSKRAHCDVLLVH